MAWEDRPQSTLPAPEVIEVKLPLSCLECPAILMVVLILIAIGSGTAQSPGDLTPKLTQYSHTAWRVQDGTLPASPLSIAQTVDGYIWLGTESGLVRFDGVHFLPVGENSLTIYSLLASRDGALWMGTARGVRRLGGPALPYKLAITGRINELAEDAAGNIWVARTRMGSGGGPLCEFTSTQVRCFGTSDGMPCQFGQGLTQDVSGSIWLNDGRSLCSFPQSRGLVGLPGDNNPSGEDPIAETLSEDSNGRLLIGLTKPFGGAVLQRFESGHWHGMHVQGLDRVGQRVEALFRSSDRSMWVGTRAHGLYHIGDNSADHFGTADGLSGDSVNRIFQDREGSIWVATSSGVDLLHIPKAITFSTREGLPSDYLNSIVSSKNGDLWLGMYAGLAELHHNHFVAWQPGTSFPGRATTSMVLDRSGDLLLGVDADLTRLSHGHFTKIKASDGSSVGSIVAFAKEKSGNLWLLTAGRQFRLFDMISPTSLIETKLGKPRSWFLAADPQGGLWLYQSEQGLMHYTEAGFSEPIPTPRGSVAYGLGADGDSALLLTRDGLLRWNSKTWTSLSSANGLPCDSVRNIMVVRDKGWWLSQRCGFTFISNEQIQAWERASDAYISVHTFDGFDGAHPSSNSFGPSGALTPDGRAWFATTNGLEMIDINHSPVQSVMVPVHISGISGDGRTLSYSQQPVRLPPLTRDIRIDYNALSFVTPQRVKFKYRLSGVDTDWQDVGTRREAFYMNLRPGHYLFQVIASNSDGVWNTVGDSLPFTLLPKFYQTKWFLALEIVIVLLSLLFIIRIRTLRATELLNAEHRERLRERDRIARELHDTLLQGFHGLMLRLQTGVELIPSTEPAKAILHDALNRADLVLVEGRSRVHDLRDNSSDRANLFIRLQHLAANLMTTAVPSCTIELVGSQRVLDSAAYDEIFLIGREAVANAFRHAGATEIVVQLRYSSLRFVLTCRDNGRGIPEQTLKAGRSAGHYGLVGMQERALKLRAVLKLESEQPVGTVVKLRVPAHVAYDRRTWSLFRLLQKRAS